MVSSAAQRLPQLLASTVPPRVLELRARHSCSLNARNGDGRIKVSDGMTAHSK
jgi:hypothetical protein